MSVHKLLTVLAIVLSIFKVGMAGAQQPGGSPMGSGPLVPRVMPIQLPSQSTTFPSSSQSLTPAQADGPRKLTPEQRSAAEAEFSRSGGTLTPQAVEALKARPEFRDLSPEEITKGRDLLERREKGLESRGLPARTEKRVMGEETDKPSLFQRYRLTRKYQDISTDLKPFGYEFFKDAAVRVLTERQDIPVPADYMVGPGDEVKILLWGRLNAQYNLIIDRNGNITLPQIGPIRVAGMTFEQMAKHLVTQSEQIVGANIDVTMGALKTIPIFVLGDVKRPGAYTIGSFATMTDALVIAGGPSEIGSMRNIQLRRSDKILTEFDLYDLLLKGDKSKDKVLQAGDIVFVGVAGPLVGVAGNVRRPAVYELKQRLDLSSFFELAGGIIPTGYTQQIQVERIVKNESQVVIDLNDKTLVKAKDFSLQDGDLVKIFPIVDKDLNVVYLTGNAKRPGKYQFKPGMRITDLVKDPTELLEGTHFDYALIKRLSAPAAEPVLIPVSLKKLFFEKDRSYNIELQAQDTLYVFSKWFFRDRPSVTIEGEVRKLATTTLAEESRMPLTAEDLKSDAFGPTRFEEKGKARQGELGASLQAELARTGKPELLGTRLPESAGTKEQAAGREGPGVKPEERNLALLQMKPEEREIALRGKVAAVAGSGGFQAVSPEGILAAATEPPKMSLRVDLIKSMKVRDAILAAGGLTRDAYLEKGEIIRLDAKQQPERLYFSVGSALAGDQHDNLLLQDQDTIIIHSNLGYTYKRTVAAEGSVLRPGVYQYSNNMTVKDLVFAAGNVAEAAYLDEAELSSQIIDEGKSVRIDHRAINLRKALQGDPAYNVLLKPYDRLFVKRIPEWSKEQFVTASGEIRFPGKYILRKGERLSDLIERAGGYAPNAYLRGAVFTRQSVKELQQKNLEEMIARMERELLAESSTVTSASAESVQARQVELQQKQAFIESLKKLKATGRMTVRIAHMRLLKGSEFDIELENGDNLYIPMSNNVVNVMGAVMSNASLVYTDKAGPKDYVQMAGGYSRYADAKNTYVLKVDGSARKLPGGLINWSDSKDRWELAGFAGDAKQIESGDTIVVPEKLERIAWLREIKDITQIFAQLATVTGIVYLMTK